jgi:hypothetical protein
VEVKGGQTDRKIERFYLTKTGNVTGVIEVNVDKTKCMVMHRGQIAGLSRSTDNGNSCF